MRNPVICADGYSYDQSNIETWLQTHLTSPVTGLPLIHQSLLPNRALRNVIEEWSTQNFFHIAPSDITIGRLIGKGPCKTVSEGTYQGCPIAVLRLHQDCPLSAEAAVLVRLGRHPSLIQHLGVCTTPEEKLLLTELAPYGHGSLLQLLRTSPPGQVTLAHRLVMKQQICSGLAALAAEGVIHRDLAAHNVLVYGFDPADPQVREIPTRHPHDRSPPPAPPSRSAESRGHLRRSKEVRPPCGPMQGAWDNSRNSASSPQSTPHSLSSVPPQPLPPPAPLLCLPSTGNAGEDL